MTLLAAHGELKTELSCEEMAHFKPIIENGCPISSNALWFSPATQGFDCYIQETQKVVNGTAKVKLYKEQVVKNHKFSLMKNLATYTDGYL